MLLDKLEKKGLIHPPPFVPSNTMYLTIMGSVAYGVADTSNKEKIPDNDIYGFCIPPKNYIFHKDEIPGFGTPGPRFEQWQQHHIVDPDAHGGKGQEYDFQLFSIVKFFELCRQGNPNLLDSLFTPENCVLHCTQVGRMVRDNRKLFVSKEIWKKFRGYAFSNLHKAKSKQYVEIGNFERDNDLPDGISLKDVEQEIKSRNTESPLSKLSDESLVFYYDLLKKAPDNLSIRKNRIKEFGTDTKLLYHLLRLLDEAQQLLETGEMDLQRAREAMKSIRRGEWKIEDLISWAQAKEKELDLAFTNCKLPAKADEEAIKKLLIQCLEEHYGNLNAVFQQPDWATSTLRTVDQILNEVRSKLYQT
jgi:uncharacterized protein